MEEVEEGGHAWWSGDGDIQDANGDGDDDKTTEKNLPKGVNTPSTSYAPKNDDDEEDNWICFQQNIWEFIIVNTVYSSDLLNQFI